MPKSDCERRYRKRSPTAGPIQIVDGVDLGPSMRPQDIYILLRHTFELEDDEMLDAFAAAADRVEADLSGDGERAMAELTDAQRERAMAEAREVSRSRLDAWRRRGREMSWLELRMLLLGLRLTR